MKMTFCSDEKSEIKNIIRNSFCREDALICIDFDDVITAVECNEKDYTEETVNRVFNEILKEAVTNAREDLKAKMEDILRELNG